MRLGTIIRAAIVVLVIALVILYTRGIDGGGLLDAVRDADPLLLVAATLGHLPLVWLKSVRMRILLGDRIATPRLMSFFVAGYAADNLVMSQAGIALRVALIHRDGVPLASVVTSHALEKIAEGASLSIFALPVVITRDVDWMARPIAWCLGAGAVAVAVAIGVIVTARRPRRFQRIAEAVRPLRDPRLAATVFALSVAHWIVEVAMIAATLAALRVEVPLISASLLVIAGVSLSALVPGLPANLGSFEMICVLVLATFGLTGPRAIGFAIAYHALHTIPVTVIGLPGMCSAHRTRPVPGVE